jgi:hypothetical protein
MLEYISIHHPVQGNWWSANVSISRSQVGVIAVGSKVRRRNLFWNCVHWFCIYYTRSALLVTPLFRSFLQEASKINASVLLWQYYCIFLHHSYIDISPFCDATKHLRLLIILCGCSGATPPNCVPTDVKTVGMLSFFRRISRAIL